MTLDLFIQTMSIQIGFLSPLAAAWNEMAKFLTMLFIITMMKRGRRRVNSMVLRLTESLLRTVRASRNIVMITRIDFRTMYTDFRIPRPRKCPKPLDFR